MESGSVSFGLFLSAPVIPLAFGNKGYSAADAPKAWEFGGQLC